MAFRFANSVGVAPGTTTIQMAGASMLAIGFPLRASCMRTVPSAIVSSATGRPSKLV